MRRSETATKQWLYTAPTPPASVLPDPLLARLACPLCRGALYVSVDGLRCRDCSQAYPIVRGVVDLRPPARTEVQGDSGNWAAHWSPALQQSLPQRFFSAYRKTVFARTVRHFVHKHLGGEGVFLEAGSGTSETSLRLTPSTDGRLLVAVDLIPEVLEQCAPIMDVRVAADIFHLPFGEGAIDGVWNVGVMEHFTAEQIDAILREFARVMRPGARLVLLWPGTDSIPQRLLDTVAWVINWRPRPTPYRFHPPEISRLRSRAQGREVLERNGFTPVEFDAGLMSGMAFKVVVGERPASVARSRAETP